MVKIKKFSEFINEDLSDLESSALKSITLEEPPGSNRGERVEIMQRNVGISPGDPWCAAFVYTFFKDANLDSEIIKRIPKTGGVNKMWQASSAIKKISKDQALANPNLILPGMVFCYLSRNESGQYTGKGHTGVVISVDPGNKTITSIEGNTNPIDGAREGFGSFLVTRKIEDPSISNDPKEHPAKMLGFIDFLDGYRNDDSPEYKEFIDSLPSIEEAYKKHTDREVTKIKAQPELLDQYSDNYRNK